MQLQVINEVARIATLDLELRPMLQRITDTLASKFGWEFVALVTIDPEHATFRCEALTTTADTTVHVGYGRALGSGVVGQVAATGLAVVLDDVRTFPNYVETMPGAKSEICVPVKHHGQIVAVLNLESRQLTKFSEQLPLLETVADTISGAIASAQLYDELRQRARLMEMMSEVSRTALDATDLGEVLQRIVDYIAQRFPLELVSVVMYDAAREEFIQTASAGTIAVQASTRWPVHEGVIGRCIRTNATQLVEDVTRDSEYVKVNDRTIAELVVPIRFRGEVVGVLNVESASSDVFTPANVLAFEAFADQVAGAINLASLNAHLAATKTQLEQKTRDLEQANEHLANAIETLHRISTQDGLTGVSNRRHFDETLALEWRRAARSRAPLSLLMLDIDFFKAYNDGAGHQLGDDTLRRVAQTLRDSVHRAGDLVSRYGGEEFVILLPETDAEHARLIAESIRERIETLQIEHASSPFGRVTASIGVATCVPPRDGTGMEPFVGVADEALYDAKRLGRNRVVA
jgi:diguanylate cyclase (GGDEF)-like protein